MPPTWNLPEYLERKRDLVEAYREQLRSPAAAPAPLRATVKVAAGTGARPIQMREHIVMTDAGGVLGGHGLGPTAPELLLGALASCLAHSALVIAADRGLHLEQLEIEVTGQLDYRGTLAVNDHVPVAPTDLAYLLRVTGSLTPEEVATLERDIAELCPILRALTSPTPVTGRTEVVAP
ncbi:OsmC family protein [Candidatus Chloroploca sp. Khr17]|uniref:OsmC family protein n=1 Tax=Candidatus Chloroploca sp. Khr17 TaxID=2496869 RepID=UPI00101D3CEF|nr:OsmC family protein [Candidatus Chloroploca sp. Khr17]